MRRLIAVALCLAFVFPVYAWRCDDDIPDGCRFRTRAFDMQETGIESLIQGDLARGDITLQNGTIYQTPLQYMGVLFERLEEWRNTAYTDKYCPPSEANEGDCLDSDLNCEILNSRLAEVTKKTENQIGEDLQNGIIAADIVPYANQTAANEQFLITFGSDLCDIAKKAYDTKIDVNYDYTCPKGSYFEVPFDCQGINGSQSFMIAFAVLLTFALSVS